MIKFKDLVQPKDHKLIPLTQGKFAKVDNEDFEELKNINWVYNNKYARNIKAGYMHRLIINTPINMDTDHINHDTLDNRKSNLRICSRSKNNMNTISIDVNKKSIYKGVTWFKRDSKWKSQIMINYKNIHIGYFSSEFEAAKAYDKKAKELFGEFALTNF